MAMNIGANDDASLGTAVRWVKVQYFHIVFP
jgi:hypothetical protein